MTLAHVDDPEVVPEPEYVEPLRRFTIQPMDPISGEAKTHQVRSPYVEDNWLPFISPNAFVFARKVDGILSTNKHAAVDLIKWADEFGITQGALLLACHRLVRYGLASWNDRQPVIYYLLRQWPNVPVAILTPTHRRALLALPDEVAE